MNAFLLLLNSTLVGFGSSMVLLQTAEVPSLLSVAYRMLAAGAVLILIAWRTKAKIRIKSKNAGWVAAQGLMMFGLAYVAFYNAAGHIPTGLAALVLSLSPLLTALVAWVVLGASCTRNDVLGMVCGTLGIVIVFSKGFSSGPVSAAPVGAEVLTGLGWAVLAAFATAIGTVLGARNQQQGLSGIGIIGWGLIFGAGGCLAVALVLHVPISFSLSNAYLGSLAYLVLAASVGAFLLYFELIRRVGPARASFSFVLVPIVAIAMSVIFEGLPISGPLLFGAATALAGNVFILAQRHAQ